MAELEGRSLEIVKEGKNHAHIAIPTADGSVQTVIAWAHADEDGNVTVNSAEGRTWPENLRRAGKATVTLMADGNPYEWVSIQTSLSGETHEGADEQLDALAKKYVDADEYPWRQPDEKRILFTLKPERVSYVKQG
jgi:PPOX class probable F420-dependent enzyme